MSELETDIDEDDDEFIEFEDAVDHFVAGKLAAMEAFSGNYPTRDGFVAQAMLLIEMALLGVPMGEDALDEARAMILEFDEPGMTVRDPPTEGWASRVIKLAVSYIEHRREIAHHEHHVTCPNCNPPENRNN